ncbi:MAG: glutathione ABC transporter permease GsiC, partial [Chloroflexota bacterium]|nr:glutathione ABC transporter permease GsiC [Chloroflexota bacterium]
MKNYILRRFMLFVPTLIGASLVIFAIMRIIPGDVALMILMGEGGEQSATQDALEMLRAKLGTDKPLYEQYGRW